MARRLTCAAVSLGELCPWKCYCCYCVCIPALLLPAGCDVDNNLFGSLRRPLLHKMAKRMARQMCLLLLGLLVCTALAVNRDTEGTLMPCATH
jgi:hypothetical protein